MATDGPSWADQWGAGGIGAMADDDEKTKDNSSSKKKKTDGKAAAAAGLLKTKAAAMVGAQMIKSGTASGIKWVKNKCQKKSSSK